MVEPCELVKGVGGGYLVVEPCALLRGLRYLVMEPCELVKGGEVPGGGTL